MNATFEEITLASFLHDVGKLVQRAKKENFCSKDLEAFYAKSHHGLYFSHQHVLYTHGFLEAHKDVFPDNINVSRVIELASAHHSPSSSEEWIIAEADRISSGADRAKFLSEAKEISAEQKLQFFEKPLVHPLSALNYESAEKNSIAYCKLSSLENANPFAVSRNKISSGEYEKLFKDFEKDFSELKNLAFDEFLESLNTVLRRYWWCIPSATNVDADISLYQHAKTTAAFANCLYRFYENEKNLSPETITNKLEKKFLFSLIDISGIQKYIFNLKIKTDSAKMLRAKSFEIFALQEILARFVCSEFKLASTNIVINGGGKAMLLLPNVCGAKEKLQKLREQIENYFLEEFAGNLNVIISDGVEAASEELSQNNAQNLFQKIYKANDSAKLKKMQSAIFKRGFIFDELYDALQKNGACPYCETFAKNSANENEACDVCNARLQLGGKLLKNETLFLNWKKLLPFRKMVKVSDIQTFDGISFSTSQYEQRRAQMFLPYTAPQNENENLKTFEELAKSARGNKKLALFKADIDNLGFLFSTALGKRASLSRYADMSFFMNYFFTGFFRYFIEQNKIYSEALYTVFSGGDDMCVLGAWDTVLQFASDFHDAFQKMTNENPCTTLSAAIALFSATTPIELASRMAEMLLEKSKARKTNDGKMKNAITIFDTTVDWNTYKACLQDGEFFASAIQNENASLASVYKLIDFSNRAEKAQDGKLSDLIWRSAFSYFVAKNIKDETIKQKMLSFATTDDAMIASRICASYALYANRSEEKNNE